MEHFDNFEDFFREQFEDFESETDPESWSRIREQLHPKQKRRIFAFWWLPVGVALLGMIGFWLKPAATSSSIVQNRTENISKKPDNQIVTIDNSIVKNEPYGKKDNSNVNSVIVSTMPKTKVNNTKSTSSSSQKTTIIEEKPSNTTEIAYNTSATTKNSNIKNDITKNTDIDNKPEEGLLSQKRTQISLLDFIAILPITVLPITAQNEVQIAKVSDKSNLTEPIHKQKQHIQLYATVGLSSNYKNINPVTGDEFSLTNIKTPSLTSTNRAGWQANIGVQIPLIKHWAIRPSLNYQGYLSQLQYDLSQPKVEDLTGIASFSGNSFAINDYPTSATIEKKIYHSFNAQADLMYFFNKKNALSAGVGIGRLLGTNPQQTLYLNTSYKHQFARFSVEPYFQYHISNYRSASSYYNYQPYSIGINFGLK